MQLERAGQATTQTLEAYYRELAASSDPATGASGAAMLVLLGRLRALRDPEAASAMTSSKNLWLGPIDSGTMPICVTATSGDRYEVEVDGERWRAGSIEDAVELISDAIARSPLWAR